MSLESDIRLLQRLPLLSGFSEDMLRLLAFSAENRSFGNGQRLFSAGDRADAGYLISTGEIAIHAEGHEEDPPVDVLGPGRLLGELSLIVEGRRTTTAIARGPVEVMQIRRALFRRILDEYPEVAAGLRERVAGRLLETSRALMTVARRLDSIDGE